MAGIAAALALAPTAFAATFTVNSADDVTDVAGCDLEHCSLREAIEAANAAEGPDIVWFSIGAGGAATIQPTTSLPDITAPITIDGTTQPGYEGTPIVELDGSLAGTSSGLTVTGGSSTIKGLVVNRFWGFGLVAITGGGNLFVSNRLGTDPSGTVDLGNGLGGINLQSADNRVGTAADGNLISGNGGAGVQVNFGAAGTVVEGNRIGTSADGTQGLGNSGDGVSLGGTTTGTQILGNLISGNGSDQNSHAGIHFHGSSTGSTAKGNLIGTNAAGSAALGSFPSRGIWIEQTASGHQIGGTAAADANVISGNEVGISVRGSGNTIQGNFIGTDASGAAVPNRSHGVLFADTSSNNAVGGTAAGAGNVIAHNAIWGIFVFGATGNAILGNSIHSNGALGIDLTPQNPTPNDAGDLDTGANDLQNFPVLTQAEAQESSTLVVGHLDSKPNTTYRIELYVSPTCDASGHGEGAKLLTAFDATTDSAGHVPFGANPFGVTPGGWEATATATDPDGNTSEFSACETVVDVVAPETTIAAAPSDYHQSADATFTFASNETGVTYACALDGGAFGPCPETTTYTGLSEGRHVLEVKATDAFDNVDATPAAHRWSVDTAPSTGTVDQGYGAVTTTSPAKTLGGTTDQELAQVFTVGASGRLHEARAMVRCSPAATVQASIETLAGDPPSGVAIASASASVDGTDTFKRFLFRPTPALDAGGRYALVLRASGASCAVPHTEDGYGGGSLFFRSADTAGWVASSEDMPFATFTSDGAILAVNSANDLDDGACTSTHCSLREAIAEANATAARDTVTFAIGSGAVTIAPASPLPPATAPVVIDGTSQPGYGGAPIVRIDGLDASVENSWGLRISGGDSVVRGLAITRFTGPSQSGIRLDTAGGNVVAGNYVGTTGSTDLGNTWGVLVLSGDNALGGTSEPDRNVVSGNGVGILLQGSRNVVQGNFVGTTASGSAPLGNDFDGIQVTAESNAIGGSAPGAGNVVSANGRHGIIVQNAGLNVIKGNNIGTGVDVGLDLGNAESGVRLLTKQTTVGGIGTGETNRIAFNRDGVFVLGNAETPMEWSANTIRANSIVANDRLGIDLEVESGVDANGVTANDPAPDVDDGPNHLQNFPVLTSARKTATGPRIVGTLTSAPSTAFHVDYYASPACDPSGNGEGRDWLGYSIFSTNADGVAEIDTGSGLTAPITAGHFVTATATAPDGSTSEFSACVQVTDGLKVNSTADPGDGVCDATECTLREAIAAANTEPGADRIVFDIPGTGVQTIRPATALPAITDAVTIDGYSQPGASPNTAATGTSATLLIEIDNSLAPDSAALAIEGAGSTVQGLVLNRGIYGIRISGSAATGNVVRGNFVGTDATGTLARTNGIYGVIVAGGASGNTIGGTAPADRNLVSGNTGSAGDNGNGVGIATGASSNVVTGNLIGTTASGTAKLPNATGVIVLSGAFGNTIGGEGAGARNVVAGNDGEGIRLQQGGTNGNAIKTNRIGVGDGGAPLGNGGPGVLIVGDLLSPPLDSLISGNEIAFNSGAGVQIPSGGIAPTGHAILANSIHSNGGLGIDLGGTGPTANDAGDGDSGPNELQNFPVLDPADPAGTTVSGTLDTELPGTYTIEVFAGAACDPSGHGEGQTLLASTSVGSSDDVATTLSFAVELSAPLVEGTFLTATATDETGNTSEFGPCLELASPVEELSLSVDQGSVPAGADEVPLDAVPAANFELYSGSPNAAPVANSPVANSPVANSPVANSPVANSPVANSPVANSPVANSGIFGLPVANSSLATVLLSSVPVDWASVLAGSTLAGQPTQTLTLQDVVNDPIARASFEQLEIGSLRLEESLLRGTRFSSLLFGSIPLAKVPPFTQAAWCAQLVSCVGVDVNTTTVLGLDVAGYLGEASLGTTTVGDITDGIAGSPVANSPVANSPVANSDIERTTVARIPISQHPSPASVVDCAKVDCATGTFGDAARNNAFLPGATFADLEPVLGDVTINELVIAVVGLANLPWELWPVDGFQEFAGTGRSLRYRLAALVPCPAGTVKLNVLLGHGFMVDFGTSTLAVGSGAAVPVADPVTDPKTGATWTLTDVTCPVGAASVQLALAFDALPGFRLGAATASVRVTVGSGTRSEAGLAPVVVTQNGEVDDDRAAAPEIAADTLVIGHVDRAAQVDWRRFRIPGPGHVTVYLNPPAGTDLDLFLVKPRAESLQASPVANSPVANSPVANSPLEDRGGSVNDTQENLPPEGLQDAPVANSEISSSSITRGDATEVAEVVIGDEDGFVEIAVAGYNGAHDVDPYTLRVKFTPPRELPGPCPARAYPHSTSSTGTLPLALPETTRTLFLFNRRDTTASYGATETGVLLDKLQEVAARPEVLGQVLEVDGDPDVRAAKDAWDQQPCSLELANDVVRQINELVARYRGSLPDLEYVVLVGSDELLPMARVPDLVSLANESAAAGDVAFTTDGYQKLNALFASMWLSTVMTDDAYTSFTVVPWLGRELYLPEIAGGRLLETPDEMVGQLQEYIDTGGLLNPASALTTSGDLFMQDGSRAVNDELAARVGPLNAPETFLDQSWGPAALSGILGGTEAAPGLFAPNAHYSHWQLQPAQIAGPGDVLTTQILPAPAAAPPLRHVLMFSIGCHFGLPVTDLLGAFPLTDAFKSRDWPQGLAQQRSAVVLANTGYGYGHTEANALSERLFTIFARELKTNGSIGHKWVRAKQEYFATMGTYEAYDEKALVEATLYGLPFYRLGGPDAAAPAPVATAPDPAGTGVAVASFDLTQSFTRHDVPGRGSYWTTGAGDLEFAKDRPIQPRVVRDATAGGGLRAHGVRITALTTHDVLGVDLIHGTPTVARADVEGEPDVSGVTFPANLASVNRSQPFGEPRDALVTVVGQSRPGAGGLYDERLVDRIAVDVLYSTSSDFTAPRFSQVGSVVTGTTATFFARATDESAGGVVRVVAFFTEGAPVWRFVVLQKVAGSDDLWTGTATVSVPEVEAGFYGQDAAGNVAYTTDKGILFISLAGDDADPEISIDSPTEGQQVTLGAPLVARYGCSDTGGVATCAGPVASGAPLSTSSAGEKSFTVEATDLSGNTASLTRTFTVRYDYEGFFAPVSNDVRNRVKAGRTVPVKFRLKDGAGGFHRELSAVASVASRALACDSAAEQVVPEEDASSTAGLKYDATEEQYVYTWSTAKDWAGTCRRLVVRLDDGSEHTADFSFAQ